MPHSHVNIRFSTILIHSDGVGHSLGGYSPYVAFVPNSDIQAQSMPPSIWHKSIETVLRIGILGVSYKKRL
jgi:hypothetical protein